MAEEIGSIEARITADTSDFTRGLLAAEAEARAFAFDVNKVGTDTNEFANALKYAEHASQDAGKAIGDASRLVQQMGHFLGDTERESSLFQRALLGIGGSVSSVAATIAGFIPTLLTFSGVLAALAVAVVALIDLFGTLVAIVADAVAPVTLVVGLLGGLGAAFLIAGKRASEGGGKLNEFSRTLATLHSMFDRTSSILAHVFLPYLVELAQAGEKALNFLDRIAKLPLRQAFDAIDTRGVNLLQQFVDRVAEVTAKPIRLAFQVAFGDSNFSNAVSDWWHRFTGFLFGYVEHHPVEVRPGFFKMQNTTVDGIFQPLIDWFNRHNFTKQGIKIGHALLGGFTDSEASHRIGQALAAAFADATVIIARGFVRMLVDLRAAINHWGQSMDHQLYGFFADAWARTKANAIHTFNSIVGVIRGIWDRLVSFIEHPLSINIDWPSPPSWLTGLLGGGGPSVPGRGGSGGTTNPTGGGNARPLQVIFKIGEREFGQAIIDTQRGYGRQNAGRSLAAVTVVR